MARAKTYDPGVLQEAPDDALDHDVLRKARDTRTQAAHASDDQRDRYAGLRGTIQSFDNAGIDQRIELGPNGRRAAGFRVADLGLDQLDKPGPDAVRRNRQFFEMSRPRIPCDEIEQPCRVVAQRRVTGE